VKKYVDGENFSKRIRFCCTLIRDIRVSNQLGTRKQNLGNFEAFDQQQKLFNYRSCSFLGRIFFLTTLVVFLVANIRLFSRDFAGDFTGEFTGDFIGDFAGDFTNDFTSDFSGDFTGDFASDFTDFAGGFTDDFTDDFTSDFTGDFIGNLTNFVGISCKKLIM
jgi:hypothetical protein